MKLNTCSHLRIINPECINLKKLSLQSYLLLLSSDSVDDFDFDFGSVVSGRDFGIDFYKRD